MKAWTTIKGQRIHRLLGGRANVYLLQAGPRALLVDTGRRDRCTALSARLDRLGIARIALIVLTHTHYDHAENAAALAGRYGAAVVVQEREAGALRRGDSPLPRGSLWATRWLMNRWRSRLQPRCLYPPVEPGIVVGERLGFEALGFPVEAIHLPGHSPGSLALVVDDEIALVGDTLFGVLPGSVWPPFADDTAQLLASWERLLATPCRLFLPGHGGAIGRDRLARGLAERRG